MRFFFSALVSIFFMSTAAWAADGSSGCGPGWYVFQENSLVSSALRGTTNAFLFPTVTVGMTIGTSNCTKHKIVTKEKESLYFATMNHFELKGDIASGRGEYLSAFAATMGCPAAAQEALNANLRQNFTKIYPNEGVNPENTLLEVYKVIFSDKELTAKCSLGIS